MSPSHNDSPDPYPGGGAHLFSPDVRSMTGGYILALDLGTTHCKATVFDSAGRTHARSAVPIGTSSPQPGRLEQDLDNWLLACEQAISTAVRNNPPIDVIGLSSQMNSLLYLDYENRAILPVTLHADTRGTTYRDQISDAIRENRPSSNVLSILPRMLWFRDQFPQATRSAIRVCGAKAFLALWLTGIYATDLSSGPGLNGWPEGMAAEAGISAAALSPVVTSTTVVGSISSSLGTKLGIKEGTPVVIGASDGACGNLGVGAMRPGRICIALSTSGVVRVAATAPPSSCYDDRSNVFAYPLTDDLWFWGGLLPVAGSALTWMHSQLGGGVSIDQLLAEAAGIVPGSDGLYFLPPLESVSLPTHRPTHRGAFYGISLAHTRGHLVRSILEGVAYGLRTVIDILDTHISHSAVTGGGAQSRLWRQIVTDTLGLELDYHADGTSLGAAMLAAVGCGMYHTLEDAEKAMVPAGEPVFPALSRSVYNEGYNEFRALATLEEGV